MVYKLVHHLSLSLRVYFCKPFDETTHIPFVFLNGRVSIYFAQLKTSSPHLRVALTVRQLWALTPRQMLRVRSPFAHLCDHLVNLPLRTLSLLFDKVLLVQLEIDFPLCRNIGLLHQCTVLIFIVPYPIGSNTFIIIEFGITVIEVSVHQKIIVHASQFLFLFDLL